MLVVLHTRGSSAAVRIDRRRAPASRSGMSESPPADAHLPDRTRPLSRRRRLPRAGGARAPPLQRSDAPRHLRLREPPGVANRRLRRRDLPLDGVGHRADDSGARWEASGEDGAERLRGELRRNQRNRKMLQFAGGADGPGPPHGRRVDRRSGVLLQSKEAEIGGV